MTRLRKSDPNGRGWTRRGAGRGFVYLDADGERLGEEDVARVKALVIPPAWSEVWICPFPNGHIQAIGTDEAGRRQYLYHPQWRARRDRLKHDHVIDVARRLPRARKRVREDLRGEGLSRERVLALAFALLDVAYLRIGNEAYARDNGSYGLSTLRRKHARVLDVVGGAGEPSTGASGAAAAGASDEEAVRQAVELRFPAKSGKRAEITIDDPDLVGVLTDLVERPGRGGRLLAWYDAADDDAARGGETPSRDGDRGARSSERRGTVGGEWHDVTSADVGGYVREVLGEAATPKDFRTWHATVLAARGLAAAGDPPSSQAARRRIEAAVVREVADELGNTPAVCRSSYIDPRVIDLWERGETIGRPRTLEGAERAVRRLLS